MAIETKILTKTLNDVKPIEDHIKEFNMDVQLAVQEGWQPDGPYKMIDDQYSKCQVILQQLTRTSMINPMFQPPSASDQPFPFVSTTMS